MRTEPLPGAHGEETAYSAADRQGLQGHVLVTGDHRGTGPWSGPAQSGQLGGQPVGVLGGFGGGRVTDRAVGFQQQHPPVEFAGQPVDDGARAAQHGPGEFTLGGEGPGQPFVLLLGQQPRDLLAHRDEGGLAVHLHQVHPELLGGRAQFVGGAIEDDGGSEPQPGDVALGQAAHVGAQVRWVLGPAHPGGEHQLAPGQVRGGVGEFADRDPFHPAVQFLLPGEQAQSQFGCAQ